MLKSVFGVLESSGEYSGWTMNVKEVFASYESAEEAVRLWKTAKAGPASRYTPDRGYVRVECAADEGTTYEIEEWAVSTAPPVVTPEWRRSWGSGPNHVHTYDFGPCDETSRLKLGLPIHGEK